MAQSISKMIMAAAAACPLLAGCSGAGGCSAPLSVDVATVKSCHTHCNGDYQGVVTPHRRVEVSSRAEGVLKSMQFKEGAEITCGQTLFVLDPTVYQARVNKAHAQVIKAQANADKARRDLDRIRPLYEANAASRLDLDNAIAAHESARADVAMAEADLALAKVSLGDTRIKAPISGFISRSNVDVGSYIEPGSGPLASMVNVDTVYVEFSLTTEDYVRSRAHGLCFDAHCTNPAHERDYYVSVTNADGTPYPLPGVVDFAAHRADPSTGTVTIRALVPNMPHTLMPGAHTRVRVMVPSEREVIAVPRASLAGDAGDYCVFVAGDDGSLVRRPVVPGPSVGDSVIIESGLKAGESIAVTFADSLAAGKYDVTIVRRP